MPITSSGQKVLKAMKDEYGEDKGEEVFYASINKKKRGSQKWHGATKGIKGQSSRSKGASKVKL